MKIETTQNKDSQSLTQDAWDAQTCKILKKRDKSVFISAKEFYDTLNKKLGINV